MPRSIIIILHTAGNSSSSSVFPQALEPNSSVPPPWAIAIIAAAAGVTFMWISALLVLVSIINE